MERTTLRTNVAGLYQLRLTDRQSIATTPSGAIIEDVQFSGGEYLLFVQDLGMFVVDGSRPVVVERCPAPPVPIVTIVLPTPRFEREIRYDPSTGDYALHLNGELVGFGRTYHEGEVTLDQIVYGLLKSEQAA